MLTTGAPSPLVLPFSTLFVGPACPPPNESSSPIVFSHPLEEEISDTLELPVVITLPLSPQVDMLTFDQFNLNQAWESSLGLARNEFDNHAVSGI